MRRELKPLTHEYLKGKKIKHLTSKEELIYGIPPYIASYSRNFINKVMNLPLDEGILLVYRNDSPISHSNLYTFLKEYIVGNLARHGYDNPSMQLLKELEDKLSE